MIELSLQQQAFLLQLLEEELSLGRAVRKYFDDGDLPGPIFRTKEQLKKRLQGLAEQDIKEINTFLGVYANLLSEFVHPRLYTKEKLLDLSKEGCTSVKIAELKLVHEKIFFSSYIEKQLANYFVKGQVTARSYNNADVNLTEFCNAFKIVHEALMHYLVEERSRKPRKKNVEKLKELGLPDDTEELQLAVAKAHKEGELPELFLWAKAGPGFPLDSWLEVFFYHSEDIFNSMLMEFLKSLDPNFKPPASVMEKKNTVYYNNPYVKYGIVPMAAKKVPKFANQAATQPIIWNVGGLVNAAPAPEPAINNAGPNIAIIEEVFPEDFEAQEGQFEEHPDADDEPPDEPDVQGPLAPPF